MQQKKKILLQYSNISYFYFGLAAIKTIYDDFDLDLVLTNASEEAVETSKKYLSAVYPVRRVFFLTDKFNSTLNKLIRGKTFVSKLFFKLYRRKKLINKCRYFFENQNYDEVFYAQEDRRFTISVLQLYLSKAVFTVYGDGFGCFFSAFFDYCILDENIPSYVINEIIPDRAIGLLPSTHDCYFSTRKVPLTVTNKNIMKSLLTENDAINKLIDSYTNEINAKYKGKTKCFFIMSRFYTLGCLKFEDEVRMDIDIIRKYFPPKSVVIVKPHPREPETRINLWKNMLRDEYTIVELPRELTLLPAEMMQNIMKDCEYIVSNSTALIPIKYLYDIDVIDISEILEKYNICTIYSFFNEILYKLLNYNGQGLLDDRKWEYWPVILGKYSLFKILKIHLHPYKQKLLDLLWNTH